MFGSRKLRSHGLDGRELTDSLTSASRYHRRVGVLYSSNARVAGYIFPYLKTLFPRKRGLLRWHSRNDDLAKVLAWDYEFLAEEFKQEGYGDVFGEASDPAQISATVHDWDRGVDDGSGVAFDVQWLAPDRAAEVWRDYGPQGVPDSPAR